MPTLNWKDVPLPPLMRALPKDERGFPIPVIILRDPDGKAIFSANNGNVVEKCAKEHLCGVCGNKLLDDTWVLGGPLSAFHPHGVYIDTPIHHECGTYALQVYPYLVLSSYRSVPDRVGKLNERFAGTAVLVNPTQDPNRPPFFVFAKVSGYERDNGYVYPVRPFLAEEFWLAGERISRERALEVVNADQDSRSQKG